MAHCRLLVAAVFILSHRVKKKIDAGAKLLQVYSGMIYAGPKLIQDLAREIKLG